MADVASSTAPTVTVYRNGDINFPGKRIVINKRKIRDLEALFNEFRDRTQCKSAVRRICTPLGTHNLSTLDTVKPGDSYVVVGREKFKKLKYGELPDRRSNGTRFPRLDEPIKNRLIVSGRARKAYEGEKLALRVIYIHRNGDDRNLPHRILLKKGMLHDMEQVLGFIQEKITFAVAIGGLYSLEGRQITETCEIASTGSYVAVERGRKFKQVAYGGFSRYAPFQRSAPVRLPPINHKSPQKRSRKVKSYPNSKHSTQEGHSSADEGAEDNSRVTSTTFGLSSPRDLVPSPDAPAHDATPQEPEIKDKPGRVVKQNRELSQGKKSEQADRVRQQPAKPKNNSKFKTKTTSYKVTTPPPESPPPNRGPRMYARRGVRRPKVTNNRTQPSTKPDSPPPITPENKEDTVAVSLFKASGMQQEKGKEVSDSRDVLTDKPIDLLPAEEVTEEITESVDYQLGNNEPPRENSSQKEVDEIESINLDADNKDCPSENDLESDHEPSLSSTGSPVGSPARSPSESPAPAWLTTDNNNDDTDEAVSTAEDEANNGKPEEEQIDLGRTAATPELDNEAVQAEQSESRNSIVDELGEETDKSEKFEGEVEENEEEESDKEEENEVMATSTPIVEDEPEDANQAEDLRNVSPSADTTHQDQEEKEEAENSDNSDPESVDSDGDSHSDTVDDATSPEITSPSGDNPTDTEEEGTTAAAEQKQDRLGKDLQDGNATNESSRTEQPRKSSDSTPSGKQNPEDGPDKDSYFS